MVFDISVVIMWIFFFVFFLMVYFWLCCVWCIVIKKDFLEVVLKYGVLFVNLGKYVFYEMVINLVVGGIVFVVIGSVVMGVLEYSIWLVIVGMIIWCKFFVSFVFSC